MLGPDVPEGVADLHHALSLMKTALSLIDQSGAAVDAGAQLDLAICRLSEVLADEQMLAEQAIRNAPIH